MSPLASPQAIFENNSPEAGPTASAMIEQINETKNQILQAEVNNMKDLLKRLLDDISIRLPMDYRKEIRTVVEMPEILSAQRSFLQGGSRKDDSASPVK